MAWGPALQSLISQPGWTSVNQVFSNQRFVIAADTCMYRPNSTGIDLFDRILAPQTLVDSDTSALLLVNLAKQFFEGKYGKDKYRHNYSVVQKANML